MDAKIEITSELLAATMGLPPDTKVSLAVNTDSSVAEESPFSADIQKALDALLPFAPLQAVVSPPPTRRRSTGTIKIRG